MDTLELTSLEAIELFLKANGRVFDHPDVEVVRLRVRDSRKASELLCGARRREGLNVINYDRVNRLATGGLMLEAADMIISDLLREVEQRSIHKEHVEGLRSNGKFIRRELCCDGLFDFITDVAQEIVAVAESMKPPFHRNYVKINQSLERLRVAVNNVRDREVEFKAAARGPVVVGVSRAQAPVMLLVDDALDAPAAEDDKLDEAAKDDRIHVDDAPDAPAPEDDKLDEAAKDDRLLDAPAPGDDKLEDAAKDDKLLEKALVLDAAAPAKEKALVLDAAQKVLVLDAPAPAQKVLVLDAAAPAKEKALVLDAAQKVLVLDAAAPAKEKALVLDAAQKVLVLDAAAPAQKVLVLDAAAEGGFAPALKEEEAAAGDDVNA